MARGWRRMKNKLLLLLIILFTFAAAGCEALSPQRQPAAPFIPPTMAAPTRRPTPQPTETPSVPRSTALAQACVNNLTYLEDQSIPDGTVVAPGEQLDKRWKVKNTGTCNWDEPYRLKLIAGKDMSTSVEQSLYPARSGTEAIIRIIFTAPAEPGSYRSAWQAYDPEDRPFGDPFFIEITVQPKP